MLAPSGIEKLLFDSSLFVKPWRTALESVGLERSNGLTRAFYKLSSLDSHIREIGDAAERTGTSGNKHRRSATLALWDAWRRFRIALPDPGQQAWKALWHETPPPLLAILDEIERYLANLYRVATERPGTEDSSRMADKGLPTSAPRNKMEIRRAWMGPALIFLKENPEWSDARIARKVGVSHTTLYRCRDWREISDTFRKTGRLPRGFKREDGTMEAWADPST